MVWTEKETGLSREAIAGIKAAQKRHSVVDPGCEKLTPEEFVNWHPFGDISWEGRAAKMKAAGVTDPELSTVAAWEKAL